MEQVGDLNLESYTLHAHDLCTTWPALSIGRISPFPVLWGTRVSEYVPGHAPSSTPSSLFLSTIVQWVASFRHHVFASARVGPIIEQLNRPGAPGYYDLHDQINEGSALPMRPQFCVKFRNLPADAQQSTLVAFVLLLGPFSLARSCCLISPFRHVS